MIDNKTLIVALLFMVMGVVFGRYWLPKIQPQESESMSQMRDEHISHKEEMIGLMIHDGDYRCCLEMPCTYCLEKTPGHGEGATCECLADVVEGRHPCGECIGEILEGHGNRFLAKYFATAIAEEVGEEHKEVLKQIISQKYEITTEEQI